MVIVNRYHLMDVTLMVISSTSLINLALDRRLERLASPFELLCVKERHFLMWKGGTFVRPFIHGLFEGADLKGLVPQIHELPQESAYYTELTTTLQYALKGTCHGSWLWNYHDLYVDFLFFPDSILLPFTPIHPHHPPNVGVERSIYYLLFTRQSFKCVIF
jgi:hypothetical protein